MHRKLYSNDTEKGVSHLLKCLPVSISELQKGISNPIGDVVVVIPSGLLSSVERIGLVMMGLWQERDLWQSYSGRIPGGGAFIDSLANALVQGLLFYPEGHRT